MRPETGYAARVLIMQPEAGHAARRRICGANSQKLKIRGSSRIHMTAREIIRINLLSWPSAFAARSMLPEEMAATIAAIKRKKDKFPIYIILFT